ncbi:golgin subfamily A member 7-like isoform X2 [Perca fluviatilis]|uniref:golgin subfamily A member 7-like isoform X2 n=1 Tax=Perca fluviatilis TaxID=8168 RepID=UPI0019645000|nr:golgin subfamily A member 7-like isoform X2 [Perca fluviatilis]
MAETHSLQDMRQQAAVAAKVFIQRDYTKGTVCQFQTKFPSELETRIDKQQFEETVQTLNNLYAEAEKLGSQSYIEGCLACLTAYTIFLCMETHYEKPSDAQVFNLTQAIQTVSRFSGWLWESCLVC